MDVAEDHHDGPTFRFKATLVWIGPKPLFRHNDVLRRHSVDGDVIRRQSVDNDVMHFNSDVMTRRLCDSLERLLEPAEIAQVRWLGHFITVS